MQRGDWDFFCKTLQKKQELKVAWEKVKQLSDEDQVDDLEIPKWSKKHFKKKFRYEVKLCLTPEQIAALMSKKHKPVAKQIYPVMKHVGDLVEVGLKLKGEIATGDLIAIISQNEIKVNHHLLKVSKSDFPKLKLEKIADMDMCGYNNAVCEYLNKKYSF